MTSTIDNIIVHCNSCGRNLILRLYMVKTATKEPSFLCVTCYDEVEENNIDATQYNMDQNGAWIAHSNS